MLQRSYNYRYINYDIYDDFKLAKTFVFLVYINLLDYFSALGVNVCSAELIKLLIVQMPFYKSSLLT